MLAFLCPESEVMQYASDLTDSQWELIKPLTKRPDNRGAARVHDMRDVINAILYLNKTGCQWRMLPYHFPPWKTVYDHCRRMKERGVWEQINERLNKASREKRAQRLTPSYIIVDSQSTKTNYEGEDIGFHGGKQAKGRSPQMGALLI